MPAQPQKFFGHAIPIWPETAELASSQEKIAAQPPARFGREFEPDDGELLKFLQSEVKSDIVIKKGGTPKQIKRGGSAIN